MKISKTSLSVIIFVSVVCLFLSPTTSLAKVYHLTILHTDNHHGHFTKFSLPGNPDVGGMAARSTLVNIVKKETGETLFDPYIIKASDGVTVAIVRKDYGFVWQRVRGQERDRNCENSCA